MNLRDAFRWAMSGLRAGMAYEKTGAEALSDTLFRLGFDAYPSSTSVDNAFGQHPTAYRAIVAFARNVAAMPFELFRKGTDELVEDHPVGRLFARPNALMRGTQLFEALTIDLENYGNGVWWLGPPARANAQGLLLPASIRRLDPKRVKVRLGEGDVPVTYDFSASTQQIKIPADEILHFKYWNPMDEAWGMSWTQPASGEIEADFHASVWYRKFFRRGAEPGAVLVPEGDANISEPAAERLRQSWINRHASVDKAHSPAILPRGLKLERTGIGQKDMDFANGRRFSRENVLSTAGVPPAIAGILEYANYANMMPQLRIFFHLELLPRLAYIEDVIQADLLDRYKTGLDGYFKTEAIMALVDEIGMKSEVAARLWAIGTPLAVLNDRLGMGLDLEGVEGADEPHLPIGVSDSGAPPAPAEAPQAAPLASASDEDEDDEERGAFVLQRHYQTTQLDAIWRTLVRQVHDLELKADSRWRTHLKNLRDESLGNLSKVKALRGKPIQKMDETIRPLFDLDDANEESIVSLEPIWRASMSRGVDTVAEQAGVKIDFHFTDPRVQQLLANRRQDIRGVNERMLVELHEQMAEGLAQNETEEDLRRRVLDYFGGERANSRTVARTETFSAFSGGRFEGMREAEIKTHRWVTARDLRVRDTHAALEGERAMVGEPFRNGLRFPLDPGGAAGETINCRCVTIPEVA